MSTRRLMMVCSAAMLAAASGSVLAAPPSNDACGTAQDVGPGTGQAFTMAEATLDGSVTTCAVGNADVWFRYTPVISSGVAKITVLGSNFSSGVAAFTGCGGTQIGCVNTTTTGSLNIQISPGQTYLLRVTRRSGTAVSGVLNITEVAPPINDSCLTAAGTGPGNVMFDTTAADQSTTSSCAASSGTLANRDVWYVYTAVSTGSLRIQGTDCNQIGSILQFTSYDTCGGVEQVCRTNLCSGNNIFLPITAGGTYLFRFATVDTNGRHGQATVSLTEVVPPTNDTCEQATVVSTGVYNFDTYGATKQYNPGCAVSSQDLFYSFTAPVDAAYDFDAVQAAFSPVLTLYGVCGGGEQECGYVGSFPGSGQSRVTRYLESGETVILRLAVPDAYGQALQGKLSIQSDIQPTYDHCSSPLEVSLGTTEFVSTGVYTTDTTACGGLRDAYFRFTPSQSGRYNITPAGSLYTTQMSASFSCGGPELDCQGGSNAVMTLDLRNGVPVYIRISGSGQGENRGYGNLTITQASPFTNPTNEACGTAATITTGQTIQIPSLSIATSDGSAACSPLANARDVWYSYTPNFNGYVKFDTCTGTEGDTVLSIHTTCGGSSVACNDNACGVNAEIVMPVTSGTNYRIRVGQDAVTPVGATALRVVQVAPPPSNDTCATAVALVEGETVNFDTTYAATELPTSGDWLFAKDVWYSYTVPTNGQLKFTVKVPSGSTLLYPSLEVFDACNGASLGRFRQTSQPQFVETLCVTAGQQLKIRAGHAGFSSFSPGNPGAGNLTVSFGPSTPFIAAPAGAVDENEDCAARVALGSYWDNTNGGYFSGVYYWGAFTCGVPVTGTTPAINDYQVDRDYFSFDVTTPATIYVTGSAESPVSVDILNRNETDTFATITSTTSCVKTFSATYDLPGNALPNYHPGNFAVAVRPLNTAVSGGCGANEAYWLQYFVVNNGSVSITTQPTNKAAQVGGSATFNVAASGSNLKYQWRRGDVPLSNGGHFSGVNSASMTVSGIGAADYGSYNVVVTSGCGAAISNNVSLTQGSSCPADFNGDSARDVADLFAYINAWLAKTPNANFNGDGGVDVADLFAYINAWLAGC